MGRLYAIKLITSYCANDYYSLTNYPLCFQIMRSEANSRLMLVYISINRLRRVFPINFSTLFSKSHSRAGISHLNASLSPSNVLGFATKFAAAQRSPAGCRWLMFKCRRFEVFGYRSDSHRRATFLAIRFSYRHRPADSPRVCPVGGVVAE